MRPGSTVRPEAALPRAPAGRPPLGPAVVPASIRPLSMCTTASRTGGAPVPSISMPARMILIALLVLGPRSIARHRPTLLDTRGVGRVSHPRTSDVQSEGEDNMRATSQLRQLLKSGTTLFVPGCYNALSARILGDVGFPAIYMTGYGTSLALLGMPDAGLATMTEMHLNARYIANAVPVPVIADADNGYGNAINVMRTIREYIGTGVAGIHIEDQAIPKRCGHVAGAVPGSRPRTGPPPRAAAPARGAGSARAGRGTAITGPPTPCGESWTRAASSSPAALLAAQAGGPEAGPRSRRTASAARYL